MQNENEDNGKEMDVREVDLQAVQIVSLDLPTSFKYEGEAFYVRECYETYYELVIQLLNEYDYISVTGTPGIGKSIFYDYFFSRYRNEHLETSIVTASFNKDRQLEECVVFDSHGTVVRLFDAVSFSRVQNDYPSAIHLYDGPPTVRPSRSKMVTFTSPNASWLDSIVKARNHCRLYMPVWKYSELVEAVSSLGLNIPSACLQERYEHFGGVPRYCLTLDSRFYRQGEAELKIAVEKINGLDDLQACSEERMEVDKVVHRLMHYVPDEDPAFASLTIASHWIRQQILDRLQIKSPNGRKKLLDWLDGAGKASTFAGWLFEDFAHDLLNEGGTFKWKMFGSQSDFADLTIDATQGTYERFETKFSREEIFENVYQMPKSSNYKSIDSFKIISDSEILLFQITMSLDHSVNLKGMVELFSKLNITDRVKDNPNILKLVFVVPERNGEAFEKQKFKEGQQLSTRLSQANVTAICGIGPRKKRKLDAMGITNCQQLIDSCGEGKEGLESVAKDVAMFLKIRDLAPTVKKIPQYVLKLKW